jgi:hypothetical protein
MSHSCYHFPSPGNSKTGVQNVSNDRMKFKRMFETKTRSFDDMCDDSCGM